MVETSVWTTRFPQNRMNAVIKFLQVYRSECNGWVYLTDGVSPAVLRGGNEQSIKICEIDDESELYNDSPIE